METVNKVKHAENKVHRLCFSEFCSVFEQNNFIQVLQVKPS